MLLGVIFKQRAGETFLGIIVATVLSRAYNHPLNSWPRRQAAFILGKIGLVMPEQGGRTNPAWATRRAVSRGSPGKFADGKSWTYDDRPLPIFSRETALGRPGFFVGARRG